MKRVAKSVAIPTIIFIGAILITTWPSAQDVEHSPPGYAGSQRCKVCHYKIFESWSKTKHASAFNVLKADETANPKCLECHTTGYRRGGFGSDGLAVDLKGVQCEACHGPGQRYSQASVMRQPEVSAKLGLVAIDSLTCVQCHNARSPAFKGFAYKAGLQTGTHSQKRVTVTTP